MPFSSSNLLIPPPVFQSSTSSKVSIRLSSSPPTPNYHSCPSYPSQLFAYLLAPFSLLPLLPPQHPPDPLCLEQSLTSTCQIISFLSILSSPQKLTSPRKPSRLRTLQTTTDHLALMSNASQILRTRITFQGKEVIPL